MSALTIGLSIALIAVLAAEFVNGWTDAPNAIATVISTGVMTPRQAVVMAVVMNTVGAMAGTAVAVMTDETLMARAKKDHQERLGRTPYVCPIPTEVNPPLQPRPKVA